MELEAFAGAELDHGTIGAYAIAVKESINPALRAPSKYVPLDRFYLFAIIGLPAATLTLAILAGTRQAGTQGAPGQKSS